MAAQGCERVHFTTIFLLTLPKKSNGYPPPDSLLCVWWWLCGGRTWWYHIYMSQTRACGSVHANICDSLLLKQLFSTGNCHITTESYRLAGLGGPYSRVPTFDFQPFRTVFLFFLLIACSGSFVQFPAVLSEQPGVVTPRQDR